MMDELINWLKRLYIHRFTGAGRMGVYPAVDLDELLFQIKRFEREKLKALKGGGKSGNK